MKIEAGARAAPQTPFTEQFRLQALALDIGVLQRQLVLALTDDGPARDDGALALMVACCICDRLAEGRAVLRGPGAATLAFARYFDGRESRALPSRAALRGGAGAARDPDELAYDAELMRGMGLPRLNRLRDLDTVAARVGKEILFATGLFLAAAQPAATERRAVRHEPAFSDDVNAYAPQASESELLRSARGRTFRTG